MPVLEPGKTVASREPSLRVENALAPGSYVFQLTVVDDAKNESAPATLTVQVQRAVIGPGLLQPTRTIVQPVLRPGVPR